MWNTVAYTYIAATHGAIPFSTDIMLGTAILDIVIAYAIAEGIANFGAETGEGENTGR